MTFRPCAVIPNYNHGESITAVVSRLMAHDLPIIIVDDGSTEPTRRILADLAASFPELTLVFLPENRGKGAAVMTGMRKAASLGYSHALQIDADGQHDTADVPHFLAASRTEPHAIVCGKPIYDASAPAGRRYGRYATHVWVWIETLSLAIGDSLCGYRIYPVAPTVSLIDRIAIPTRMDFDTEILVRLFWAGHAVINIPTRVIYPENGLSHFNMLHDNLRISWMHTRLFFGMLPRIPTLLWRKIFRRRFAETHWSQQQEKGSSLGLRITLGTYRLLGDKAARALLPFIVFWYFLFATTARRASLGYLDRLARHTGSTPPANLPNAFRHMLAFARAALDKLASWSGDIPHSRLSFPAHATFEQLIASGRGAVLLGGHLGNLEMLRALATLNGVARINAVVFTEHARKFSASLRSANNNFELRLIQVSHFGPDTAILLRDKIDQGEFLVIVGDRTPPADNDRVVSAEFLGAPALFPQGPYMLASLLECPVYLFFCLSEGDNWEVILEPLADRITLPRGQRQEAIAGLARQYAAALERICARAPFQWFNFFDFWAKARS
jgi:predicted LPLAT superfamily acyltransferase/GT2 family glycosyltransferase